MAVPARPYKVPRLKTALLRDHTGEQRVAGDIERNAEENVAASLIELTGQPALGDVELEEHMTRRKRHLVHLSDVPSRHDESAGIRIGLNLFDDIADLVDMAAVSCRPAAPLHAVNGS